MQFRTSVWAGVDRVWLTLGSVKVTFVIFFGILLLSIPGTLVLQENISNIDPAIQYDYDFWQWGQTLQLFRSYQSFWYVGLLAVLSVNLIICSYERWPQMWKLAFAKPVALSEAAVEKRPAEHRYEWDLPKKLHSAHEVAAFKEKLLTSKFFRYKKVTILEESSHELQLFWQKHRPARMANYLVHTSLLTIFAGAIVSGLYGFEGTLNIPEGSAVDTFIAFKEGGDAKLERPPGGQGLPNERMMDVRIEAEQFNVEFYKDFPGRPKEFATALNAIDRETGKIVASKTIRVNDPLTIGKYTFYQASYGALGDYKMDFRVIRKSSLQGKDKDAFFTDETYTSSKLGQEVKVPKMNLAFVPLRLVDDLQGYGPAVQIQELRGENLTGEPFWIIKKDPIYDFGRKSDWAVVLDDYKPLYFTGLQVAHDPGAPIYWLGCAGMLLGTFYALFFQHKKFYLIAKNSRVTLTGSTHRLPFSFEKELKKLAGALKELTS